MNIKLKVLLIYYTLYTGLLLTAVTDTFGGGATVVDKCPPLLRPKVLAAVSKLWVTAPPDAMTALWLRPRATGVELEDGSEPRVEEGWGCCPCQEDEITEPWWDKDADVEPWWCDTETEGLLWPGLDDRGGSSGGICDAIKLVPTAGKKKYVLVTAQSKKKHSKL